MRFPPDEVTKVITNQDSLLKAKKLNFLVKALEVMSVDHQGFILWVSCLAPLWQWWTDRQCQKKWLQLVNAVIPLIIA